LAGLAVWASSSEALAQEEGAAPPRGTFDHVAAIGAYGTGWAGAYGGVGVGGRIRIEPFDFAGVDLFGEALLVETPAGVRHDHPIGFDLYTPVRLSESFELRPLLGMCVVFSMIEPEEQGAPRADDVLFGMHAGVAVDFSPLRDVSFFLEAKAVGWLGHDRTAMGWTGSVGEDYATFGVAQVALGAAYHLF
jgi:hypothetical protein